MADPGNTCQCWFSINTGPNGECEKCGKVKVLPPHVPDAAPTSAGFVVAKTMPVADELTPDAQAIVTRALTEEARQEADRHGCSRPYRSLINRLADEIDRLRIQAREQAAEIERLKGELDSAECMLEDEEAGSLDTLDLWKKEKQHADALAAGLEPFAKWSTHPDFLTWPDTMNLGTRFDEFNEEEPDPNTPTLGDLRRAAELVAAHRARAGEAS